MYMHNTNSQNYYTDNRNKKKKKKCSIVNIQLEELLIATNLTIPKL